MGHAVDTHPSTPHHTALHLGRGDHMNDIMGFIYFVKFETAVFFGGRIAFCPGRPFAEVVLNPRAVVNSGLEPAGSCAVCRNYSGAEDAPFFCYSSDRVANITFLAVLEAIRSGPFSTAATNSLLR